MTGSTAAPCLARTSLRGGRFPPGPMVGPFLGPLPGACWKMVSHPRPNTGLCPPVGSTPLPRAARGLRIPLPPRSVLPPSPLAPHTCLPSAVNHLPHSAGRATTHTAPPRRSLLPGTCMDAFESCLRHTICALRVHIVCRWSRPAHGSRRHARQKDNCYNQRLRKKGDACMSTTC